jgi:hypothetical protein
MKLTRRNYVFTLIHKIQIVSCWCVCCWLIDDTFKDTINLKFILSGRVFEKWPCDPQRYRQVKVLLDVMKGTSGDRYERFGGTSCHLKCRLYKYDDSRWMLHLRTSIDVYGTAVYQGYSLLWRNVLYSYKNLLTFRRKACGFVQDDKASRSRRRQFLESSMKDTANITLNSMFDIESSVTWPLLHGQCRMPHGSNQRI